MLIQVEGLNREKGKRLPEWLRKPARNVEADHQLKKMLRRRRLHTVCEEARCPNRNDCFARGAATFMILGDVCSRSCGFCSVKTGRGLQLESLSDEPEQVAEAAAQLNLSYVVITSVNRDELPDGGASHFANTIRAVRRRLLATWTVAGVGVVMALAIASVAVPAGAHVVGDLESLLFLCALVGPCVVTACALVRTG